MHILYHNSVRSGARKEEHKRNEFSGAGTTLPCSVWGSGLTAEVMSELRAVGRVRVTVKRRDKTWKAKEAVCAEAPVQEGGVILRCYCGFWGGFKTG